MNDFEDLFEVNKVKDFFKKYYKIMIIIFLLIIIFLGLLFKTKFKDEERIEVDNTNVLENNEIVEEEVINKYKVEIKGSVVNPGVYELEEKSRVIDVVNLAGGLLEDANTSLINLSKKIRDEMVIIIYSNQQIEELKKENVITEYVYIESECKCPDTINDACINNYDSDNLKNGELVDKNDSDNLKNDELVDKNDSVIENNVITEKETEEENNDKNIEMTKISINNATLEELQTITGIGLTKAKNIIEYRNTNGNFKSIEDIKNVNGIGDSTFEKIKDQITI